MMNVDRKIYKNVKVLSYTYTFNFPVHFLIFTSIFSLGLKKGMGATPS